MAEQIMTKITNIIKDYYLPPFNDMITTEPSAFLEMIKKAGVPTGGDIIGGARYGINGGFGMGNEESATPKAFPQQYKRLKTTAKDMYCDIGISHKTVTLAQGGAGSIFNALKDEIEGSYAAAKWNIGRMLFGNGTGILGNIASAISSASDEITLDDVSKVIEGLAIDIYTGTLSSSTKLSGGPYRILYVDTDSKKIKIDTKITTSAAGFITVQDSFKNEITGLGAIFDTTNVTTLYGVSRTGNEWINPKTYDAGHDLNSSLLYEVSSEMRDKRKTNIDLYMMGNKAFKAWYEYMESTHYKIAPTNLKYRSGATGFEIAVGPNTATIINEPFVPSTETWGVQKSAFTFYTTKWGFANEQTGGAFTLVPGTHNYRGLLAAYGDLMCENPGGCVKITNCDAAASSSSGT